MLTCIELAAIVHALLFLIGIGYAQNYYFHLRTYIWLFIARYSLANTLYRSPQEQCPLKYYGGWFVDATLQMMSGHVNRL